MSNCKIKRRRTGPRKPDASTQRGVDMLSFDYFCS